MKFNDPVNIQSIWAIVKQELGVDGKAAMELARMISKQLQRACDTALQMDRIELRAELEAELKKKYEAVEAKLAAREEQLKQREEAGGGMTREELVRCLADAVNSTDKDGNPTTNVQAAKLLTELEGFGAAQQKITVNIIDYANAPDFYKTEIPEGL
jgi:hypothetical protein